MCDKNLKKFNLISTSAKYAISQVFFHDVKVSVRIIVKDPIVIVCQECANVRSNRFAKHFGHMYFCV